MIYTHHIGILLIFTLIFALVSVAWRKKKNSVSKLFLNYLTLRNVHFSDDCALIASYSAQVDCLYNMSLYSVSPSAMSRLLCITPVSFEKCLLSHQLSLLYGGAGRENTCLWLHVTTSCVFQSLPVTPHCFPLLCSQQYLWEHLCINFLLDYRSHAKDNLAWCGFKTGISLWCCSPLPTLISSTLYSPMPDGRLKSIILPTEMCFPEHYIKPQSSVQGVWAKEPSLLLDGTVAPPESQEQWHKDMRITV